MQEQNVLVNFAQGLNTKTDPWQVPIGQFLELENTVFTVGNQLTKRNGYGNFIAPPDGSNYICTYDDSLIAIGTSIATYSPVLETWGSLAKPIQRVTLSTIPIV